MAEPKPRIRAKTLHELRDQVSARDKIGVASMDVEKAKELIMKNYATDADSALAFACFVKGIDPKTPTGPATKDPVVESWHRSADVDKGDDVLLSDDASAEARKSRSSKESSRRKKK